MDVIRFALGYESETLMGELVPLYKEEERDRNLSPLASTKKSHVRVQQKDVSLLAKKQVLTRY